MGVKRQIWGVGLEGEELELFTLTNERGMQASICPWGATLVGLTVPDRDGVLADVVLGFDTLKKYLEDRSYFGSTVGRVANRLSGARFELDGKVYNVDPNNGESHLHGGGGGFHSRAWNAEIRETDLGPCVMLSRCSLDGEQGYPGNLDVAISYAMTDVGLRIDYVATTDKPTMVNMTNHAYFNLSGSASSDILDHLLTINASRYLVTDTQQLPTGEIADVAHTPFDFTRPAPIGLRVDEDFEQLRVAYGYDHYFVFDENPGEFCMRAGVVHKASGRVMQVYGTQLGLQLYTGNFLPRRVDEQAGAVYGRRSGFCLEMQGYPDAPNHLEFPSVVLRPGETYEQTTEFRFSTE